MIVQFQRLLLFLLTTTNLIFNYKISKFMEYLELIRLGHYVVRLTGSENRTSSLSVCNIIPQTGLIFIGPMDKRWQNCKVVVLLLLCRMCSQ